MRYLRDVHPFWFLIDVASVSDDAEKEAVDALAAFARSFGDSEADIAGYIASANRMEMETIKWFLRGAYYRAGEMGASEFFRAIGL